MLGHFSLLPPHTNQRLIHYVRDNGKHRNSKIKHKQLNSGFLQKYPNPLQDSKVQKMNGNLLPAIDNS